MFHTGDIVMHPTAGVCEVQDVRQERFEQKAQTYYILVPCNEKIRSRIFVPVNSDRVHLRTPLQKAQVDALLRETATAAPLWYEDEKERSERFSDILKTGDHAGILKVISALLTEEKRKNAEHKKLRVGDERTLNQAKEMIDREFSYALGLEKDATVQYIAHAIEQV